MALKMGQESEAGVAGQAVSPGCSFCLSPESTSTSSSAESWVLATLMSSWSWQHMLGLPPLSTFMTCLHPSTSGIICSSPRKSSLIAPAQKELAVWPERKILELGDLRTRSGICWQCSCRQVTLTLGILAHAAAKGHEQDKIHKRDLFVCLFLVFLVGEKSRVLHPASWVKNVHQGERGAQLCSVSRLINQCAKCQCW